MSTPMIIRNWCHTDRLGLIKGDITVLIPPDLEDYLLSSCPNVDYRVLKHIPARVKFYKKVMDIFYNGYYIKHSFSKRMIVSTMLPLRQRVIIRLISVILSWKVLEFFATFMKSFVGTHNISCERLILTSPSSIFDSSVYLSHRSNRAIINEVFSWDNVSSRGFIPSYKEKFSVWNKFVKNDLMSAYHVDPSEVSITGIPFYEFARQSINELSKSVTITKPNGKSKVLYTTGETSYLTYEPLLVKHIYFKIEDLVELTIRIHPLDNLDNYKWCEKYKNIKIQIPGSLIVSGEYAPTKEEYCDYFKSLGEYDVILNIASTTSLDSLICDANVANINFMPPSELYKGQLKISDCYKTDHYSKILAYNIIPNLQSIQELRDLLNNRKSSLIKSEKRYRQFKSDFFCVDNSKLENFNDVFN